MDPFSIAALVAMLGGAAMQHKAGADAAKRQRQAILDSQIRQREFQRQAEQRALNTADTFNPADRKQEQTQVAEQVTQDLMRPVADVQAANDINSRAQGAVSKDYDAAKTTANLTQMKNAEALARLLGKTTAAGRLRQNEAVRLGDAGQDINRLNNFAQGQARADQLGIEVAGTPNPWLSLGGSLVQGAGSLGLASGGMGTISKLFSGGKAAAAPINLTSGSGLTGFA